ncbi:hypothetical protein F4678DRAFT_448481 [Xylaria arbuscula]|nr:hypothetical protein F4678DRAFT_448481 [Xylaria arbuscula]
MRVLGGTFKITLTSQVTNQYDRLLVGYYHPGSEQEAESCEYEGRLYRFNNLGRKQKRYRLRSVQRLAARAVFRAMWMGNQVIIFRSGSLEDIRQEADDDKREPYNPPEVDEPAVTKFDPTSGTPPLWEPENADDRLPEDSPPVDFEQLLARIRAENSETLVMVAMLVIVALINAWNLTAPLWLSLFNYASILVIVVRVFGGNL